MPGAVALMGVVNVTPDSFSDGGRFLAPERAIEHGLQLVREGAALLDIGGESTRPGASPVSETEELERVCPVIQGLIQAGVQARISIDTTKAAVARAALDAGAEWINDISAGESDPEMVPLAAERDATLVLMHMRGRPSSMQADPRYQDPVSEIVAYLRERQQCCLRAGMAPHKIVLDPGIGFGKRLEHNLDILRRLPELRLGESPLLLGVSRKSFIGHLMGSERQAQWSASGADETQRQRAADRIGGTAAAVTACVQGGADILRVHDVQVMAEAVSVASALCGRPAPKFAEHAAGDNS
ncbi:MAG: dihydropteroate synthase [Planctomycetota bacterium]|jgi:dihydropteroate synthase